VAKIKKVRLRLNKKKAKKPDTRDPGTALLEDSLN
jgi:hypothetical protein